MIVGHATTADDIMESEEQRAAGDDDVAADNGNMSPRSVIR